MSTMETGQGDLVKQKKRLIKSHTSLIKALIAASLPLFLIGRSYTRIISGEYDREDAIRLPPDDITNLTFDSPNDYFKVFYGVSIYFLESLKENTARDFLIKASTLSRDFEKNKDLYFGEDGKIYLALKRRGLCEEKEFPALGLCSVFKDKGQGSSLSYINRTMTEKSFNSLSSLFLSVLIAGETIGWKSKMASLYEELLEGTLALFREEGGVESREAHKVLLHLTLFSIPNFRKELEESVRSEGMNPKNYYLATNDGKWKESIVSEDIKRYDDLPNVLSSVYYDSSDISIPTDGLSYASMRDVITEEGVGIVGTLGMGEDEHSTVAYLRTDEYVQRTIRAVFGDRSRGVHEQTTFMNNTYNLLKLGVELPKISVEKAISLLVRTNQWQRVVKQEAQRAGIPLEKEVVVRVALEEERRDTFVAKTTLFDPEKEKALNIRTLINKEWLTERLEDSKEGIEGFLEALGKSLDATIGATFYDAKSFTGGAEKSLSGVFTDAFIFPAQIRDGTDALTEAGVVLMPISPDPRTRIFGGVLPVEEDKLEKAKDWKVHSIDFVKRLEKEISSVLGKDFRLPPYELYSKHSTWAVMSMMDSRTCLHSKEVNVFGEVVEDISNQILKSLNLKNPFGDEWKAVQYYLAFRLEKGKSALFPNLEEMLTKSISKADFKASSEIKMSMLKETLFVGGKEKLKNNLWIVVVFAKEAWIEGIRVVSVPLKELLDG